MKEGQEAVPVKGWRRVLFRSWWAPLIWGTVIIIVGVAIAVPVVLDKKPWIPDDPDFQISGDNVTAPFVSVEWLVEQMASPEGVTVLDARAPPSTFTSQAGLGRTIPGAVRAQWPEFADDTVLLAPDTVAEVFRTKGVSNDRPVVVYGGWSAANYWGEEGRIFWQLHWLNHTQAFILHGGIWAWDNDIHKGEASGGEGDFVARPIPERITELDDLLETIQTDPESIFIVDAREQSEFDGAAPFGSVYGGHIPGAKAFHWREVFDDDGNLLDRSAIRQRLLDLGFRDGLKLITYCTRGVRAGFMSATLLWAGFDVSNYAGSWRDWTFNVDQLTTESLQ